MSPDADADLERLRTIAMALPRAAEKLSHGAPVFFIEKGRSYAWFWHNHHNDGLTAVLVKTSGADEQDVLIAAEPELYFRPAYLGPSGWIGIRTDSVHTDWVHIADRIERGWRMVAPKRLLEAYEQQG